MTSAEDELAIAVIDTLLREDYGGLSRHVRGPVLELPGRRGVVLPLRADGFLADFRIARPGPPLTLEDVADVLAAISDEADAEGVAAFGAECRSALAALRLRERHLPGLSGPWLGYSGAVCYDALAAARPHPAYPTSACRLGFTDADSLRYAPEYAPEFELNWAAVPRTAIVAPEPRRDRPGWWPEPAAVGLPGSLAQTHELMPVHPLTLARGLSLPGTVAPGMSLRVRPTLSTRTVAVADHPAAHLKLPLPVSTLGLLNRRALKPGTLADGALIHGVLAGVVACDPGLEGLLLADDGDFAHAGDPCLGYLLRRLPEGLEQARIVPVAALLAPGVIDELAGRDPLAFFAAYLELLFEVQVRLFARYGIALESHQQNASVVLGPSGRLRLLVKDFDGALIRLGPTAPEPAAFADPRLLTGSDDDLADVFITITVHLCAGAIAFGLAEAGYAPLPELLFMTRRALAAALDRYGAAARLLRGRVLEADRLPGKAMVTAGTLRDKSRTGARDINKFYGTTGPNYLRTACR